MVPWLSLGLSHSHFPCRGLLFPGRMHVGCRTLPAVLLLWYKASIGCELVLHHCFLFLSLFLLAREQKSVAVTWCFIMSHTARSPDPLHQYITIQICIKQS
ncbi:uncharacterized protein BO95DRAFT_252038 [Aspergillus brunneoviolaceus CBS 621.78]|uniref:Uncharacterized protein n=1 Tax=Aspergillus brunneoviolaceus CBS 621.78 TaxID=1450534 RepID=A0ACD1FYQ9_9EURO|nr:hypothetical protein BO95DRAFT_252038 [Aspergillus brunneoviolaceus CBS 621.78]RAH42097.1 hypothetical protein BO95DRAFT_252038 [Aspergillus brunneoviolaceus CBS 621.78]